MLRIKRAHSEELRDEVYALRYRAYLSEDSLPPSESERFTDLYDRLPNHVIWALTDDERVVGSIRTTWYDPLEPYSIPELDGYAEDVKRQALPGARLSSANRFVTDPSRPDRDSVYAMLLLKYHLLVAALKTDIALAAVRANHVPFYRRIMLLERASEGRTYPGLTATMFLMACDFAANIERVYTKTPALRLRGYERIFLDEAYRDIWEIGLPAE